MSTPPSTGSPLEAEAVPERPYELVVLGANGLTGRLAVRHLTALDRAAAENPGEPAVRWAAAGRNLARVRDALKAEGAEAPVLKVDIEDEASLDTLAQATAVVLSFAGPYTATAERVVAACVRNGTSYVDISGELPLLRRIIERFDGPARTAGVAVVQMAGWEALPADVTTLLASRAAVAAQSQPGAAAEQPGYDGPGAAGPVVEVEVTFSYDRVPAGVSLRNAISAGTLGSIVEILRDPGAGVVGDPGGLLIDAGQQERVRRASPVTLRPRLRAGRVLGPVTPVAFLNPPVIHRTACLLATQAGAEYLPARYREGTDQGPLRRLVAAAAVVFAGALAGMQWVVVRLARSPRGVRQILLSRAASMLPPSGTGPEGELLSDWAWTVQAHARTRSGSAGRAKISGTGHPGYTATAVMAGQLALLISRTPPARRRAGCLTPALAVGADGITGLNGPALTVETLPEDR
ncbi:saccharopine dehydrogenase [Kineosporia sp. NBRC 101677]|uniref:saccharopine dehydrogenase NADP-binding domain-containing protein n=1 Tax=Kineosporia sp. NBRC 101677 TaxID=3032197 RepID=UPI0024A46A8C|nr:saccharopine dehydrogenase NADP-binding domain-containing protein [Kineosporia sp. NBRC 101677]GLY19629.1 saccharopine dehydrogenase [Kineosporia sp. NBRC 101677]